MDIELAHQVADAMRQGATVGTFMPAEQIGDWTVEIMRALGPMGMRIENQAILLNSGGRCDVIGWGNFMPDIIYDGIIMEGGTDSQRRLAALRFKGTH